MSGNRAEAKSEFLSKNIFTNKRYSEKLSSLKKPPLSQLNKPSFTKEQPTGYQAFVDMDFKLSGVT